MTFTADMDFAAWRAHPNGFPPHPLSNESYHKGPGVSSTEIKLLATKTPEHYYTKRSATPFGPRDYRKLYREWEAEAEEAPSQQALDALAFGTACHTAILEPDLLDETVIEGPKVKRRSEKVWKDFVEEHADRIVLLPKTYRLMKLIQARVLLHEYGRILFKPEDGGCEVSVFAEDPEFAVLRKIRMDKYNAAHGLIVDLKTTIDASLNGCRRAIENFWYHLSAPYYLDTFEHAFGERLSGFLFVFVEKEPPFGVRIVELDRASMEFGRRVNRRALRLWRECVDADHWPGYPPEPTLVELRPWALQIPPA